jgi:hypothetical protein
MTKGLHSLFVGNVRSLLLNKGFVVETEVPLDYGKGAVDLLAKNKNIKIYFEAKSNPASIHSKKVSFQLNKYKSFFGRDNFYCLVSPDSNGKPKFNFLDNRCPEYFI